MRDALRELAHRFHLLRLTQGLLGLLTLLDGQLHPGFDLIVRIARCRLYRATVLDVYQDARKPQRSAVSILIHPTVGFDPAKQPVVLAHTAFAAVGGAAPQRLADFGRDSLLVLFVDRLRDPFQRQTGAASRRIEAEGSGESFVANKMIGLHVPDPGDDDGAGANANCTRLASSHARLAGGQSLRRSKGVRRIVRRCYMPVEWTRFGSGTQDRGGRPAIGAEDVKNCIVRYKNMPVFDESFHDRLDPHAEMAEDQAPKKT